MKSELTRQSSAWAAASVGRLVVWSGEEKEIFIMYGINETVLYGKNGVCRIVDVEQQSLHGEKKEYYVMHPVFKEDLTLYAPVGNEAKLGMQQVLTAEQVRELIHEMPFQPEEWVDDTRQRKEQFDEVMGSGDRRRMIRMIRTLYCRQKQLQKNGKQLGTKDVQYLKDAQKRIHDEFALALHIEPEQVGSYILQELGETEM